MSGSGAEYIKERMRLMENPADESEEVQLAAEQLFNDLVRALEPEGALIAMRNLLLNGGITAAYFRYRFPETSTSVDSAE